MMDLYLHLLRVCMVGIGAQTQGQPVDFTVAVAVAVAVLCHTGNTVVCTLWLVSNIHRTEFSKHCLADTAALYTESICLTFYDYYCLCIVCLPFYLICIEFLLT
jgi:hypothetical protein